jgi:hypothetical protein
LHSRHDSSANAKPDTVPNADRLADAFPRADRFTNSVSIAESD